LITMARYCPRSYRAINAAGRRSGEFLFAGRQWRLTGLRR
jgi:hypothetical protein